jgi:tripartite-type tricarboxylate transporter receptor subunit TctC
MSSFRLVAAAVLMLSQLGAAAAQEWPTRHITAIVPFGPGNSVDIFGRLMATHMSEAAGPADHRREHRRRRRLDRHLACGTRGP